MLEFMDRDTSYEIVDFLVLGNVRVSTKGYRLSLDSSPDRIKSDIIFVMVLSLPLTFFRSFLFPPPLSPRDLLQGPKVVIMPVLLVHGRGVCPNRSSIRGLGWTVRIRLTFSLS